MANIRFYHELPDETYNKEGSIFDGMNKRVLYAMGLFFQRRFEDIPKDKLVDAQTFATWIVNNLETAKEVYKTEMDKILESNISSGLMKFKKYIQQRIVEEVDTITEEET